METIFHGNINEKVSIKSSVWVHLYNYLGKGKEMEFYRKKSEPLLWKYKKISFRPVNHRMVCLMWQK